MDIKEAIELIQAEAGDYWPLIEYEDCIWYNGGDEVRWNTDDDYADMMSLDGRTYTGWAFESFKYTDKYCFVNIDNQCGQTITKVFPLSKEADQTWI